MNVTLKLSVLAFVATSLTACGSPKAEVRTAPVPAAAGEQSVRVSNNLSQAINLYVTPAGGAELFLKQVPPNSIESVPITGIAGGTSVTFKATTLDGSRSYEKNNVTLRGLYLWPVP